MKAIHVKPSLYALYFYELKEIALKYGYNLVLHGSLNRDMDLIAIPWAEEVGEPLSMIEEFATFLGGYIHTETQEQRNEFAIKYHGRFNYIIDLNRGSKETNYQDPMYYLDISVISTISQTLKLLKKMDTEKIKCCADHLEEYPTPLIYTFQFTGYERWCPYCGKNYEYFGDFKSIEETPLLTDRLAVFKEFFREFLTIGDPIGIMLWQKLDEDLNWYYKSDEELLTDGVLLTYKDALRMKYDEIEELRDEGRIVHKENIHHFT